MPKDAVAATVGRLNAPRNPVGAMLVGLKTLQIAAVAAAAAPKTPRNAVATAVVCLLAACGQGRDAFEDGNDQSPAAGLADEVNAAAMPEQAEDRVILWGDTHLHTLNSTDAYESGVANADIDTAFRYAKGFPVVHPRTGLRIRIDEPLDFLVVADHAEMLGMFPRLRDRDPDVLATAGGQELLALFEEGADTAFGALVRLAVDPTDSAIADDLNAPSIRQTSWDAQVDAAERHSDPGTFTALNGWEWSSTPGGLNLHRVVFTPADADTARQFLPFSNFDSIDPEDLWAYLRDVRERTGADGNLEPVGDTVDPATSRYTNTIGAAELAAHWRDPEFDPAAAAFYYVRVLEIPTPHHHVSEALALGLDPAALDFATTIQERAFSSPVWYSP